MTAISAVRKTRVTIVLASSARRRAASRSPKPSLVVTTKGPSVQYFPRRYVILQSDGPAYNSPLLTVLVWLSGGDRNCFTGLSQKWGCLTNDGASVGGTWRTSARMAKRSFVTPRRHWLQDFGAVQHGQRAAISILLDRLPNRLVGEVEHAAHKCFDASPYTSAACREFREGCLARARQRKRWPLAARHRHLWQ